MTGHAAHETGAETAPVDVVVVGAGPVGMSAAVALGQAGWRVVVLEAHAEPYGRPRAVVVDGESARFLARLGIDVRRDGVGEPAGAYEWRNAAGATLLRFPPVPAEPSGWPMTMVRQPVLEDSLARRCAELDTVTIRRGARVVAVRDDGDEAGVTVDGGSPGGAGEWQLRARWVLGADGANSMVRNWLDTTVTDLGFASRWLIVDVKPHEPREWEPMNLQVCDPARPTTVVSGGPGRRRWEFMVMPGDTVPDLIAAESVWQLLEPWRMTPHNATLERAAEYVFQARWADRWRAGRVLLAGDAAHQMPPFAGQGLCSGLRDIANLAWKLDLVLRGAAPADLLDTYPSERIGHLRHAIGLSMELGKVICVSDPEAAAQRDAFFAAAGPDPEAALPDIPPPRLGSGLAPPSALEEWGAGLLAPQPRVRAGRSEGLLDDVLGPRLLVLSTTALPELASHHRAVLDMVGGRAVVVARDETDKSAATDIADSTVLVDLDGTIHTFLQEHGAMAVVLRPDGYVFAVADGPESLLARLDDLSRALGVDPALARGR